MASTVTDLQSGSLDERREGVGVLTKEQQNRTSILRMKSNSNDLLVYLGKVVNDNFFDENLLDENVSGAITSAPNNSAEKRTLGQSDSVETTYTELSDFDPVKYLEDEGLALYPIILTAVGYADPVSEDGTIGMFETRSEIAGLRYVTPFAKRGPKASLCSAAEGSDRLFYPIEQQISRGETFESERYSKYIEAMSDQLAVSFVSYQDQDPTPLRPFVDNNDLSISYEWEVESVNDPDIAKVLLAGSSNCLLLNREKISAPAGWTFLNKTNGTDSIAYSDRM
jgi:hypothetical protein